MAYGQWGNLAGYIYGTAVHYTLNPPDTRTPQEIHEKVEEARKKSRKITILQAQKRELIPTKPKIKTRTKKRISQTIQPIKEQ